MYLFVGLGILACVMVLLPFVVILYAIWLNRVFLPIEYGE